MSIHRDVIEEMQAKYELICAKLNKLELEKEKLIKERAKLMIVMKALNKLNKKEIS